MTATAFTPIPEPDDTPESLLATVKALKHAVDTLTDGNNQAGLAPSRSFVQADQPAAVIVGDTWHKPGVAKGDLNLTSIWNGLQWVTQSSIPTGVVVDFLGVLASASECPQGFLLSYGQQIIRADYPGLFAVLRTQYGVGDGSTTFNLPDLRGRVIAGLDNMGFGTTANRLSSVLASTTLGTAGGDQFLQAHAHSASSSSSSSGLGLVGQNLAPGTNRAVGTGDGVNAGFFQDLAISTSTSTTVNSNGSGGSQNVQPTMVGYKLIKT